MKKKQIALITGATGFIGSNLTKKLLKEQWVVHIIVRESSNFELIREVMPNLFIHKYDGSINSMMNIVHIAKPEIVFHLASLYIVEHKPEDIDNLIHSNILFGTHLLESMIKNDIYKLINTGTSWQHYLNQEYNPVNLYAATKQAFEAIMKFYLEATPLNVITLKLFDTYGPNDPRQKLFNLLLNTFKTKVPVNMSLGEQLVDFVFIDDVIDAFIRASEILLNNANKNKSADYAVTSGQLIKLRELVAKFESAVGEKLPLRWGSRPYRNREVMIPWSNGTLLPGWKPNINLDQGIDIVIKEYKKRNIENDK